MVLGNCGVRDGTLIELVRFGARSIKLNNGKHSEGGTGVYIHPLAAKIEP